jgi:hypothetical protein
MFWRRRAIFKFRDGRRRRRADPLAVWRRLWTDAEVNLERDLQDAFDPDLPDTESLAAMKNLADLTRRAFALPTFEQGGLTEVECQNLLADFLTYMASVKKKSSPPLMQSPPTDSPSSVGVSPTKSKSDSSSTPPASNAAAPSAF